MYYLSQIIWKQVKKCIIHLELHYVVISAGDDTISGLYAMKQTHNWFDDHEYPSLGLRRGVRTLQRIRIDNKYMIS